MSDAPHSESLRLLVVDDDPLSTTFQAHLASLLGHQAVVQTNPVQSIEQALSGQFDIMLLDLGMPGMDGFSVLHQLRAREKAQSRKPLPVIAVTGYASEADRLRCLSSGFNEHMSKPIQASSLASVLQRLSARQRNTVHLPSDADRLRATVARLREVKPGDRTFAPTVTESFALRCAQLVESMRNAQDNQDPVQARNATSAMRSSAEFLGALHLAQMCTDYEAAAAANRWAELPALLAAIDHEHQAVLTLLFESNT